MKTVRQVIYMALWLCRAGKLGEYETKFIEDKKIYCTWSNLDWDMSQPQTRDDFKLKVIETYPNEKANSIRNQTGQLWMFARSMKPGDWVVVPSKIKQSIYIGKIESGYCFDTGGDDRFQHFREIEWLKEVPRSAFDQDLLYSFGAFMTVCQISRNDAESRVQEIVNGVIEAIPSEEDTEPVEIDIESNALQEIADQIIRRYKGHDLARKIVAPILEAKGFTTYVSPTGPDKGVDILASQGSLGFDHPRICVQVKSGSDPVDRPTHDQLIGAMSNHKADYGLLVSWGGFRNSIINDIASHFFKVRLWTHMEIVQEFLRHYEKMLDDVKEAIPLKQIWIIDKRAD